MFKGSRQAHLPCAAACPSCTGAVAGGNLDVHADALLGGGDDAPLADSLLGALQVPGGGK